MHIAFLNPQGNFDPNDSYWTAHPDFGGQLVYVKQVALAMGEMGHTVDILTRQIVDPDWPEFSEKFDAYPGAPNVRIVRLPAGPETFLRKELLWPHLIRDWVPNIIDFYEEEGAFPDAFTGHYGDGGVCGALLEDETGIPYTFTAHSLGAQKMDKLGVDEKNLVEMDEHYHFGRRLMAERLSMNRSYVNITSTTQERFNQYSHNAYRGAVDPTDERRFEVVPPGVALDIFDRNARYTEEEATYAHIREMLARDLGEDRIDLPCIVASSRLDPKKNHLSLVEAFAGSDALRERANLVIITGHIDDPLRDYEETSGSERAVLEDIMDVVEKTDLAGEISMFALRGQGALAAGYRFFAERRSVFALTAFYEPFGLAPLEAIASGLPAIVTKNGGPSESLREGDTDFGVLVDPADPEEISVGLYELIASEDRWQHFAEAGYQRVMERYTWERTAEGYLGLIAEALDDPAGRRPTRLLPIPAYFRTGTEAADLTLDDLYELYLQVEVLSVGETLVDFISHEKVSSLRAADNYTRYLGGQPANVAVYVSKLGGRAAILSKVGADIFGDFLEEQLQRHGVSTETLLRAEGAGTTTVFISRTAGIPDFQVNRGADALLSIHDVVEQLISRARVVHTSMFALSRESERSAVRRALRLAHKQGKLVTLDANYSQRVWPDTDEAWEVLAQILPYVTAVRLSAEHGRRLLDYNMDDATIEQTCPGRLHELGADIVVLTRAGKSVVVSDGTTRERVELRSVETIEQVTGASDAFWAGVLMARLDDKPWSFAVRVGHEVAAEKLHTIGHVDGMIDRQLLYDRLDGSR